MGYHPRIIIPDTATLVTIRCRNSELWLINNKKLEQAILGLLAKFIHRYNTTLYAFAIEGNHIHALADFNPGTCSSFMRDLNSGIAKAVARHTPEYPGGRLWARRFSSETVPLGDDIREYFFYVSLQSVKDGLVEKISDYPGYTCFSDASKGIERCYSVINWSAYNEALVRGKDPNINDYSEEYTLKYERIPGYEKFSQQEYSQMMHQWLEERRKEYVKERYASGKGFAGRTLLLQTTRGSLPKNTKTSGRYSHRPRVLTVCGMRRKEYLRIYFDIYYQYYEASARYRNGESNPSFPPHTFKPPHVPSLMRNG